MTKDVQRRFRLTTQISFAADSLSSPLILIVSFSLLILSRLNSQFHLLRLSDISASPYKPLASSKVSMSIFRALTSKKDTRRIAMKALRKGVAKIRSRSVCLLD